MLGLIGDIICISYLISLPFIVHSLNCVSAVTKN